MGDEERGMLDSLVDDKAIAGAQESPDDVRKAEPCALMVGRSGDASWRRCGKRRGWQVSALTHNRSAKSP